MKKIFVLKEDISITIEFDEFEKGDYFEERLVGVYASDDLSYHRAILKYNGTGIEFFYFISVDGGRMYIPTFDECKVTSYKKYKIASILSQIVIAQEENAEDRLKYYLKRAKIEIED